MAVGENGYSQNLEGNVFLGHKQFAHDISTHAIECIKNNTPFAFNRCGDGELWVLNSIYNENHVLINCPWKNQIGYCGVTLPNVEIARRLKASYENADVVGIFNDDWTKEVFTTLQIDPKSTNYAFSNIGLPMHKPFIELLKSQKPLMIGKFSKRYYDFIKEKLGVEMCGCIEIDNYTQIDKVLDEIGAIEHTIALLSCAVPAKIIAVEAMQRYGKVYLDVGHCFDNAINPIFESCWLADF